MPLDLLLASWIIVAGLLGFRDGSVRKLTSLVLTGVSLFLAHLFMRDVAGLLINSFEVSPESAPILGFLLVFVGIILVQSIVYKLATDSYKIGGLADRVAGSILGVFQGILFLSGILYILLMVGVPSRQTKQFSKIYKSVVNVAPQVLDLFTTVRSQSLDDLQEMAKEKGKQQLQKIIKPGEAAADSLSRNRLLREVRQRAAQASGGIDTLRANARR